MAFSLTLYRLFRDLKNRGILANRKSILEIGEANWYGEPLTEIEDDLKAAGRVDLLGDLAAADSIEDQSARLFAIPKALYKWLFDVSPDQIASFDKHGTAGAIDCDLNESTEWSAGQTRADVVINHGTAEHIFNIAQVFRTMHDECAVGGLMIHEAPMVGWIDHGFYTLQPTLFFDVAAANQYKCRAIAGEIIGKQIDYAVNRDQMRTIAEHYRVVENANAMMFCCFEKTLDAPFAIPRLQGYYGDRLSVEGREAWHKR